MQRIYLDLLNLWHSTGCCGFQHGRSRSACTAGWRCAEKTVDLLGQEGHPENLASAVSEGGTGRRKQGHNAPAPRVRMVGVRKRYVAVVVRLGRGGL